MKWVETECRQVQVKLDNSQMMAILLQLQMHQLQLMQLHYRHLWVSVPCIVSLCLPMLLWWSQLKPYFVNSVNSAQEIVKQAIVDCPTLSLFNPNITQYSAVTSLTRVLVVS